MILATLARVILRRPPPDNPVTVRMGLPCPDCGQPAQTRVVVKRPSQCQPIAVLGGCAVCRTGLYRDTEEPV